MSEAGIKVKGGNQVKKFKAWHKDAEKMIEDENYVGEVFNWLHQGQPLTICRPSELNDDEGHMIYEGHIIEIGNTSPPWLEVVVFRDGMFKTDEDDGYIGYHLKKTCGEGCKIRGNIYEHNKTLYGVTLKGFA